MRADSACDNQWEDALRLIAVSSALDASSLCSLSLRERGGVRGYGLSIGFDPPHPNPLPAGERERTALAARYSNCPRRAFTMLGAVVLASALSLALACGPALAQTSQKPIQIIVPFAPGASADGAARIVANELGPRLGRQVAVENKAGAGGTLGLQQVAKSTPDGDTLGVALSPALPTRGEGADRVRRTRRSHFFQ